MLSHLDGIEKHTVYVSDTLECSRQLYYFTGSTQWCCTLCNLYIFVYSYTQCSLTESHRKEKGKHTDQKPSRSVKQLG